MKKALIIVDVQNDFCPGGALPVPNGDEVVQAFNKYIKEFEQNKDLIIASRDWHTKDTKHFKINGGIWPVHCVQNSKGAEFHFGLKLPKDTIFISKGMEPGLDGYSAFDGKDEEQRFLEDVLKQNEIKELHIGGLATDYCVKSTVISALEKGFKVYLLADAIRGIDPKTSEVAIQEMQSSGAKMK